MGLEAHLSVCTLVTGAKRLVHDGMLTGGPCGARGSSSGMSVEKHVGGLSMLLLVLLALLELLMLVLLAAWCMCVPSKTSSAMLHSEFVRLTVFAFALGVTLNSSEVTYLRKLKQKKKISSPFPIRSGRLCPKRNQS